MNNFIQSFVFIVAAILLVKPLGSYMARIYTGNNAGLNVWFAPLEKWTYKFSGIDPEKAMPWTQYVFAVILFNILGLAVVYLIQRFQAHLPLNPMAMPAVAPDLAFNTAVSFASNTNWQSYGGETTLSYFSQMTALTVQNFLSAATGMAVLVAFIRGFIQKQVNTIGNFWVDLVRSVFYILIPLSIVLALALVSQGVVQTLGQSVKAELVQPVKDTAGKVTTEQIIAVGPVASQIAIKQLGSNGGGFFNVNSAHPMEDSNPLANFLELLAIILIPASLCYTYGDMVKDKRQGWAILAAMFIIFIPCLWACMHFEQAGNPLLDKLGIDQRASAFQPGGNMEGKEARFGIANSVIWAVTTTAVANGSVNAMHDSFTPLGGLIPMWLMQLGEVVFGGVGCGLYGMLAFVIVAVFISGLMIGRTPEYLGKKIEAYEMKMASIILLIPHMFVLTGTALGVALPQLKSAILNPGPHGLSEVLYAFSSCGNNNGSAFAGLSANNIFYNIALAMAMFFARYWLIIPTLAIAGSLSKKKIVPVSQGTLPTHTPLFVGFLVMVVLIVGALTFFPALALGPIAEHLSLYHI